MRDTESYRLLFGPYRTPRCRVGGWLECEYRGRDVTVGGLTDAPIQWPYARQKGLHSPILCGDLIRAVKKESVSAVAHHWGVGHSLVHKWRLALGVTKWTIGTTRLITLRILQNRRLSQTPAARDKMSKTRKGMAVAPQFLVAARKAAMRRKSEKWREQTSERMRREWASGQRHGHARGRPWTNKELKLLGTKPDNVVAEQLGRSEGAVQRKRWLLGIPVVSA
jgi:hypothetical protein